jgi:hypothetical protein
VIHQGRKVDQVVTQVVSPSIIHISYSWQWCAVTPSCVGRPSTNVSSDGRTTGHPPFCSCGNHLPRWNGAKKTRRRFFAICSEQFLQHRPCFWQLSPIVCRFVHCWIECVQLPQIDIFSSSSHLYECMFGQRKAELNSVYWNVPSGRILYFVNVIFFLRIF